MQYTKVITPIAILAAVVALFVNMGSGKLDTGYEVGDIVEGFQHEDVTGKDVALADYESAKGVILIFTCNTCPFSQMYESRIIDLHSKYEPLGYPVVAINPNDPIQQAGDSFEEMKKRAQSEKFNFPYLYDESQETVSAFGASRTPHVYLLNNESAGFRVKYIGAIDNNHKDGNLASKKYVEDAVDALLSGNEVSTTFTKAIGCGIKWKRT